MLDIHLAGSDESASRAQLAAIVSMAADAIIATDSNQLITLFNSGAERVFGFSSAEILGQPLTTLVPEQFRNVHDTHVRHFATTQPQSRHMGERGRIFGRRRNGDIFDADAAISHFEIEGRRSFTVILRDVGDALRMEEALQQSEARLKTMYDSTLEYIGLLDPAGAVIDVNRAALRLLDLRLEDVVWWGGRSGTPRGGRIRRPCRFGYAKPSSKLPAARRIALKRTTPPSQGRSSTSIFRSRRCSTPRAV